ncbi:G-type lectin S-receptor-like serine/threonine-protein kinase SD1-1 [Actinidia eriantha]|uniref:G-type lectin S-receptor-like serine/threonine-protein kinase SD1-1 n=1 Tax=Actinidia eriantha TaxID=165200 RepID=UPI00258FD17C|nr:G-type lectin S-receptor-like serine/threonine-protein kinase SD1-1 [Actinidia eriantha]
MVQRYIMKEGSIQWDLMYSTPKDPCDNYGQCGANSICRIYKSVICECGRGCLMWFGDLIDIKDFIEEYSGQDIYIRFNAKVKQEKETGDNPGGINYFWNASTRLAISEYYLEEEKNYKKCEDWELPLFDRATIAAATNNFSQANMLGQGGFGSVYKANLPTGQELAVKKQSKGSGQGIEEFNNEVVSISKLQHRNPVKLLGCCVRGEERILIYEFMPNKSLDYFIFDENNSRVLCWKERFDINMGIAQGLLYLHQDSRIKIIHKDLKASNVLLDNNLNPKISDFGLARIFEGDEISAKTKRVVGTYGYMSPEYAIDEMFSAKSDVFSFGVLILEMISGKRNRGFSHPDHHHSLLGHAWLLWNENKALDVLDPRLKDSYVESQVLRCVQVGLLCVQKLPAERPTMSSVVFMLGNEEATLCQPKQPGFFIERSSVEINTVISSDVRHSQNALTVTMPVAR